MIIEAIATGKTLLEAQEAAVAQLGDIGSANVEFEILAHAKPKTLGIFGGSLAKVRAYYEAPDKKEPKAKEKSSVKVEPEKREVTSAVMNAQTQEKVLNYLTSILQNMGVENIKIDVEVKNDGTRINFDGDKLKLSILFNILFH